MELTMQTILSLIKRSEKVKNKDSRFGACADYYPAYVELLDGVKVPALFTESQLMRAIERAGKNTEDINPTAPSFFERLVKRIF
jgi:hypothetical protein